jgi:Zn-dependent protease
MKSMPHSAEMEALVGYGGPLLGTVAAFVCYIIFQQTGWLLFLMLAQVGFLLNLFNLIPVSPMDGGRVTAAISRWFWLLGLGVILAYFIYGSHHPILLIVLILGAIRVFKSFFGREPELDESYYAIAPARRIMIALAYFGLVAVLAYMSLLTHAQVESLVKF